MVTKQSSNPRRNHLFSTILAEPGYLLENGYRVEPKPKRFFALELDDCSGKIWAYDGDTLAEIATALNISDTTGVERVEVYDLDNPGELFTPVRRVVAFVCNSPKHAPELQEIA